MVSAEEYRSVNELVTYPQIVSGVLIQATRSGESDGSKKGEAEDMGGKERARSEPHGDADDKCGDSPVGRCN